MSRRARVLLLLLVILIAGGLALQTPILRQARALVWQTWVSLAARAGGIGAISVSPDVMQQLQELRAQNIRLDAEVKRLARLQNQVGDEPYAGFNRLPALIRAQPIDTFQSRYLLNRGAQEGVQVGAPVVVQGSVLIGFIAELTPHSSLVQLVLHPTTNVPVEVSAAESEEVPIEGLVEGRHFTSVLLTTVPRDRKLVPGQPIVTAAEPERIPYGLVIGLVRDIKSAEHDAYQTATIDLPYDPETLEAVVILTPRSTSRP